MEMFTLVILTILIVLAIIAVYILVRNQKVHTFRTNLLNDCSAWSHKHINSFNSMDESALTWCYLETADYDTMVYSIRPLIYEEWLTPEMIDKLNT